MHIAADALQEAVQQLDQAMYNHEQWFKNLDRTLVCRATCDERDLASDSYRQCPFGQWYYHGVIPAIRDLAGFESIGVEHQRMHEIAASLLQVSAEGGAISPYDYDAFANSLERLRLQIQTLRRELTELLYRRDPLTGAESRLSLLTVLREQHELLTRGVQKACSIAMMDLDSFKRVNDTFGHPAGDKVLVEFAAFVMANVRPYDKLFRYGGEEFLLCLPGLEAPDALAVVERIRVGISAKATVWKGRDIRITASCGIAWLETGMSVEHALEYADKVLYAAKAAGRNVTKVWDGVAADEA